MNGVRYDPTENKYPQEFDAFIDKPENADKLFEFIHGEIVEKPSSNPYASEIAGLIIFFLRLFLREHGIEGHITEGQGGYVVAGEKYAPDVAYISKARQPKLARKGYNPNPPELAVEIESPTSAESEQRLRVKLVNYLVAGVLVWVVYPETREVKIYSAGYPNITIGINNVLDGGDVLPGFTLAVKDIFPE